MARRRREFEPHEYELMLAPFRDRWRRRFPPSVPRAGRGGIKAQSRRGAFGHSWWAKRWIGVLEGMDLGARLGRGRRYARGGQVLAIEIEKGAVRATVQGSQLRPYKVRIKVRPLTAPAWKKLARGLSRQALFTANLLAGQMPENIEEAFEEAGLSLFPASRRDLETGCSCPDWSNPCKHIAAVYYLLGEEFDRDPFLIFKLRGMGREELVALLEPVADAASGPRRKRPVAAGEITPVAAEAAESREPLRLHETDAAAFWNGGALPGDLHGEVTIPGAAAAALLRRLGPFPFWRGVEPLFATLERIYSKASAAGMEAFLAAEEPREDPA